MKENVITQLKKDADHFLHTASKNITFDIYRQFMRNGERQAYEAIYFERRKRITTFGLLVYLFPNNKVYVQALENEIWQVCNEFTWCLPAHIDRFYEEQSYQTYSETNKLQFTVDLFAAETAFTLAEFIYLFQKHLDNFLIEKIKIEINRRIFNPFLERTFHWEKATHNWASVCGGSIGAAALYLLKGDERLPVIINKVRQTMAYYLAGFKEDGACTEGYGYWQYGFGYFVYFADLLKNSCNIDLFRHPKVKAIATFQQKVFLAENRVVNFSDAEPFAYPRIGFTHFLHKKFPEVHVPNEQLATSKIVDDCGRWAPAVRELLWYNQDLTGQEWPFASYWMEDSAIFVSRNNQSAFAMKAGKNDEPHNHNDIGHFILYGYGDVFLRDLGSGEYNKEYFSEKRYQFICNSSEGHSVPVINGNYQLAGESFYGKIHQIKESNESNEIEVDLSYAYSDDMHFKRRFYWKKLSQPSLEVIDIFHFKENPTSLIESFIAADLPFELKDSVIYLIGQKKALKILYEADKLVPRLRRRSFRNHQGQLEYYLHILFEMKKLHRKNSLKFEFKF